MAQQINGNGFDICTELLAQFQRIAQCPEARIVVVFINYEWQKALDDDDDDAEVARMHAARNTAVDEPITLGLRAFCALSNLIPLEVVPGVTGTTAYNLNPNTEARVEVLAVTFSHAGPHAERAWDAAKRVVTARLALLASVATKKQLRQCALLPPERHSSVKVQIRPTGMEGLAT